MLFDDELLGLRERQRCRPCSNRGTVSSSKTDNQSRTSPPRQSNNLSKNSPDLKPSPLASTNVEVVMQMPQGATSYWVVNTEPETERTFVTRKHNGVAGRQRPLAATTVCRFQPQPTYAGSGATGKDIVFLYVGSFTRNAIVFFMFAFQLLFSCSTRDTCRYQMCCIITRSYLTKRTLLFGVFIRFQ